MSDPNDTVTSDPLTDHAEIQAAQANVHSLYLLAQEKLNEARAAEIALRQRVQELYIIASLMEDECGPEK